MPTLSWLTREKDVKSADAVAYRLLERDDALSFGDPASGNMLIQGDNQEALKSLLPYYRGQVKCIYIDPPPAPVAPPTPPVPPAPPAPPAAPVPLAGNGGQTGLGPPV